MLESSRLVAFVATAQPSLARAFYEGVLGLRLVTDDHFALVFDANGTTLRIAKVDEMTPAPSTVLGWSVADIAMTVEALTRAGVAFERFESLSQDEVGIWVSPGGARVAWFKDPDGNLLSVTQP
jgi:catechol 2,3-dioxygenase-like lactoylglutathione lyase family enzyme